ncbi:MAG: hypothetical protein IPM34_06345 [Saprospiraceae bacterium]|nr:hypothetical protein [Saprospiraceae bacterium]
MNHLENIPFTYEIADQKCMLELYKKDVSAYFIVNDTEFRNETSMKFLDKILEAVHLTADHNASIVSLRADQFVQIPNSHTSHPIQMVFFGIPSNQLRYQGKHQLHELIKSISAQFLFAKNLSDYQSDLDKKLLWKCLKEMFLL